MFFLGHSGILLSLLLASAFPLVFLFSGNKNALSVNLQENKIILVGHENSSSTANYYFKSHSQSKNESCFLILFQKFPDVCKVSPLNYSSEFHVNWSTKDWCMSEGGNKAPPAS